MGDHRGQVNNNLNDNFSLNLGGKEISRSLRPSGESWSPEKPLVRFVTTLLILNAMSYVIRAMGVLWAFFFLLPNLVIVPYGIDFYFIIVILLAEGIRIFYLNYDDDWRVQSLWTVSVAVKASCRVIWKSTCISKSGRDHRGPTTSGISSDPEEPLLLPDADDSSGHFLNKLLYCLQLLSASICITLSVVRFIQLSIHGDDIDPSTGGYRPEAYVFYGLAFFQAFFSLLEEVYWEWKITYGRLLEVVAEESNLGIVAIKSFCYHAYRECDKGNISYVLSFNLFLFASKLLNSHSRDDRLIGVQSLHILSNDKRSDTLRNIGKSMPVIQKLLHMLSWSLSEDAEIRKAAARILANLAERSFNSFRLLGFLGLVDNILDIIDARNTDEVRILGITIVEKLSHGSIQCGHIAHSEQLMNRLSDTFSNDPLLQDYSAKIIINLCKNKNVGVYPFLPRGISDGLSEYAKMALKKLMESEVKMEKPPQIVVELARLLLHEMGIKLATSAIKDAGTEKLTKKLVQILQECYKLAILEPPNRMTREQQDEVRETAASTIGLAIATMRCYKPAVASMKRFGMEEELRQILEANTSILGCQEIRGSINCALELLQQKQ